MKLILKLLSIDFINSEGKQQSTIMPLKMPDRNNGKDDLSLCEEDKNVLKSGMNKDYTFVDAHVICTEYSHSLIPEKINKLFN